MKSKRLMIFVLLLTITISLIPAFPLYSAYPNVRYSETEYTEILEQMRDYFYDGGYWSDHNGVLETGINKGTSKVGSRSCGQSYTSGLSAHCGTYVYDGKSYAYQCHGYAVYLGVTLFGTDYYHDTTNWKKIYGSSGNYALDFYAGDIVRLYNKTHTIFIYKVTDTTVYYTDCNGSGPCRIRWSSISVDSLRKNVDYVVHYQNNVLKGSGEKIASVTITYNSNGGIVTNADQTYTEYTVLRALNLRSGPGLAYDVYLTMPVGTRFTVSDSKISDGYTWGKISYNGLTGWCVISNASWAEPKERSISTYYTDSSWNILYSSNDRPLSHKLFYDSLSKVNDFFTINDLELTKENYEMLGWATSPSDPERIFTSKDKNLSAEDFLPGIEDGDHMIILYAIWQTKTGQIEDPDPDIPIEPPTEEPDEDIIINDDTLAAYNISGEIIENTHTPSELTIDLYNGSKKLFSLDIDNGSFEFINITEGRYTIKVRKDHYVTNEYIVNLDDGDSFLNISLRLLGDLNGDGKINITDVGMLNAHVKKKKFLIGEYTLKCADINNDGMVNITDVALLNAHNKKVKPLW